MTIIQLINEPVLWDDYDVRLGLLKDYYGLAYHEVRKYNPDVVVAVSDAFIGAENWYYFGDLPEYHSVMLDTHKYQVNQIKVLLYNIAEVDFQFVDHFSNKPDSLRLETHDV